MGQGESGFSGCRLGLPQLSPTGGLSSSPPADPAFSLLSCPHPPAPSPAGKGGFLVVLCKGLRPLHPRGLNPGGTYRPCQAGTGGGGWLSSPPADPAFSLLSCPHPPSPFPSGEGGDSKFFLPGATAPGTPALNRLRHLQPFPSRTSGGGLSSSPPADPAFNLLSCPYPPCPFPAGGFRVPADHGGC